MEPRCPEQSLRVAVRDNLPFTKVNPAFGGQVSLVFDMQFALSLDALNCISTPLQSVP